MLQTILRAYGFDPDLYTIEPFGSGLVNQTWKVSGNNQEFILQRINKSIFKTPELIAGNLNVIGAYLANTAPNYIFAAPIATADGRFFTEQGGEYFRIAPFIPDSHTVNFLKQSEQAFQAASQFGKFTMLLKEFDISKLRYTLPGFHNLSLRINQFKEALKNARPDRVKDAGRQIKEIEANLNIATIYKRIVQGHEIPLRVIHHDAKINNVLFDGHEHGLTVIDLDTVMPGFYISDVGDMMRTYLAEATEEEKDLDKIVIRHDFFAAIYRGYISQMNETLTQQEKDLFIYAGEYMIYMQALRFLTDFLNGDIYYKINYEGQNLIRAKNQLKLLENYITEKPSFFELIKSLKMEDAH